MIRRYDEKDHFPDFIRCAAALPRGGASDIPYGYGLMINKDGGTTMLWHTGHFHSYCSMMLMIPDEGFTCTTVSNHSSETAMSLCSQISLDAKEVIHGK